MNWLKLGSVLAPYVATLALSVVSFILVFQKYVAPGINEALEEAQKTITNLAKLGGVKSQEFKDLKGLEKAVTADLIYDKMPELQALKLVLSENTWEQIEEMIDENPAAVMQLYEKWKPYLGNAEQLEERYMF